MFVQRFPTIENKCVQTLETIWLEIQTRLYTCEKKWNLHRNWQIVYWILSQFKSKSKVKSQKSKVWGLGVTLFCCLKILFRIVTKLSLTLIIIDFDFKFWMICSWSWIIYFPLNYVLPVLKMMSKVLAMSKFFPTFLCLKFSYQDKVKQLKQSCFKTTRSIEIS